MSEYFRYKVYNSAVCLALTLVEIMVDYVIRLISTNTKGVRGTIRQVGKSY